MAFLLAVSRGIDWTTERVGKAMMWLVLAAVLVSSVNAIVRYTLRQSSNAWLELQWYLFGAVFLLGAAYTLQKNEHIRIDIVSSRISQNARNWIDIIGHVLFLAPLCLLMIWLGVPFFLRSFASGEVSSSAGGLIVWPAKLLIPLAFVLLLAQAFSELVKRIAFMKGLIAEPNSGGGAHGSE